MTLSRLEQSYRYGYQITARASSTFALAGRLLPADIQPHFWVLYGFCRLADDWVDEQPNTKLARRQLAHYRTVLAGADYPADELIWPGLMATIERFTLPRELLFDLLSGLVSDLSRVRLADEASLLQYCYQVAGTVGELCARVFGVDTRSDLAGARSLGIAMQLTNIGRDLSEDLDRDRIYLPQSWLQQAGVSEAELLERRFTPGVQAVVQQLAKLAARHYAVAQPAIDRLPARYRATVRTATALYAALLPKLQQPDSNILQQRVRLSGFEKMKTTLQTR